MVHRNASGALNETDAELLLFCNGPPVPVGSRVTLGERKLRVTRVDEMKAFGAHHLEMVLE